MPLGTQVGLDILGRILRNDVSAGTFWEELGSGVLNSVVAGDLNVSLHNADPVAGTQDTAEITWAGTQPYARQPVTREALSWNETSGRFVINVDVDFGANLSADPTQATHFSLGTRLTGPGFVVLTGPMSFEISRPFTVDNSLSGSKIIVPGHSFFVNAQVQFREDIGGAGLPSGINSSGFWFVVTADSDGIGIASTQGGSALPLGDGSGRCARSDVFDISPGGTVLIPAGSLTAMIG